jgi:hypothetical protein
MPSRRDFLWNKFILSLSRGRWTKIGLLKFALSRTTPRRINAKRAADAALKIYEPLALDGSFNARRYTNFIIRSALCPAVRVFCLSEFAF